MCEDITMDSEELFNEYIMPYEELTRYLIKKYGKAEYDYYTDPSCTKRNPNVSRISEGLFCHHIDEDKGFNLGESSCAKLQSFEWQKNLDWFIVTSLNIYYYISRYPL